MDRFEYKTIVLPIRGLNASCDNVPAQEKPSPPKQVYLLAAKHGCIPEIRWGEGRGSISANDRLGAEVRSYRMLSKTMVKTQALAVPLLGLALLIGSNGAEAKGCIKGAVVGGVAGHVAGHHGVLGAAAGCAVGHHLAKKKQQQLQQQQQTQPQKQQPPPQQSAPGTAAV
jgi:hypothetical protein